MDNYSSEIIDFYINNYYYDEALWMLRPYMINIRNTIKNFTGKVNHPLIAFMNRICPGVKYYIESYYRFLPEEEIASDITICLLLLMHRYQDQKKCFLGYMNTAFPYEYCRMLMKQNREILNHNKIRAFFDDCDANLKDEAANIDNMIDKFDGIEDEFGYLTNNWINSILIESPFQQFDETDRKILLDYYQEKLADSEIAATTYYHINTINQRRLYCLKRLEDTLKIKHIRTRRYIKKKE